MQVLNKYDKKNLVIKLHQEGKTIREIAAAAHLSFGDIDRIIKKLDGDTKNESDINLRNKAKLTQAIYLFKCGKKPIDVAIELDISANEIENILQEYWFLNQLDELALVYYEIRNYLDSFLKLFHILKRNKMLKEKQISKILKYADQDLPILEAKIRGLRSEIIDLEFRKRDLNNTIKIQSAQLIDLGQAIMNFQNAIERNKN